MPERTTLHNFAISSVLTPTKFIGIIELGLASDDLQVALACGAEGQEELVVEGQDLGLKLFKMDTLKKQTMQVLVINSEARTE